MDETTLPNRPARGMQGMNERLRARFGRSTPLRILAIVLLIVLVGVAIFAGVYASRQPRPTFATAHIGNVILSVQTTGAIQATVYQADFPVDGALSQIDVTVGQQVHKGDALAKLNVAPFQSALTAAQNAESAAQQSLYAAQDSQGQSQNSVDSSESALSAQQSYAQNQCASAPNDPDACAAANAAVARGQAQVDAAQAQLAAAQAQAAAAQTVATKAQAKSQIAQAQLAATTLAAPHDGVVTSINGSVGGRPGATASGLASFITIMDTTEPLATASVGYGDIGKIKAGQSATFRVKQAAASAIFTGVVTGVSPLGQGAGSALSYPVSLRLDPASLGHTTLLPGMTADISIITRARYHVIVISNSAVRYAEQAAPTSGKGLLTAPQISAALTSAQALEQEAIAQGFDAQSDPPTPAYLIGFAHDHYVAIPVVLGLTDGQRWEVVAGLHDGQQVVNGQRNILFG